MYSHSEAVPDDGVISNNHYTSMGCIKIGRKTMKNCLVSVTWGFQLPNCFESWTYAVNYYLNKWVFEREYETWNGMGRFVRLTLQFHFNKCIVLINTRALNNLKCTTPPGYMVVYVSMSSLPESWNNCTLRWASSNKSLNWKLPLFDVPSVSLLQCIVLHLVVSIFSISFPTIDWYM